MDLTVNNDKLHLANLLGEVMDKIIEFQKFWPSENYTKGQTAWFLALRN